VRERRLCGDQVRAVRGLTAPMSPADLNLMFTMAAMGAVPISVEPATNATK
jgi:hypothetical protein